MGSHLQDDISCRLRSGTRDGLLARRRDSLGAQDSATMIERAISLKDPGLNLDVFVDIDKLFITLALW